MSLRDEIHKILYRWEITDHSTLDEILDRILALPEMKDLLDFKDANESSLVRMLEWKEKAEKWDDGIKAEPISMNPFNPFFDTRRKYGWLHKDDPVEGLEVVEVRPLRSDYHGAGLHQEVRPLTVGEAIELAQGIHRTGQTVRVKR